MGAACSTKNALEIFPIDYLVEKGDQSAECLEVARLIGSKMVVDESEEQGMTVEDAPEEYDADLENEKESDGNESGSTDRKYQRWSEEKEDDDKEKDSQM